MVSRRTRGPDIFGKSRGGEKIGQLEMRGEERSGRIQMTWMLCMCK
jgi:hypothetical protein